MVKIHHGQLTFRDYDVTVAYDLAMVDVRVRFPVVAYYLDVMELVDITG